MKQVKYILLCLSSLAIACGTDAVQPKGSDTSQVQTTVQLPVSLQQKVLSWYLSLRKGDSLNTIVDSHVTTFDSLHHKIYVDTVLYPFANLELIKNKDRRYLASVAEPNAKQDPAIMQNSIVLPPNVIMVSDARGFLLKRNNFNLGDVHLTFSRVLFYEGNYYVQVWRVMNEKSNFYNILDTFRFNSKGELKDFFDDGKYPLSYYRAEEFLEVMKRTSIYP